MQPYCFLTQPFLLAPLPPLAPAAALLCTVAYQSLVPSHWFWVLVVPLTFIYMQSGELPSWRGIEFWFIAYFGFYLKLWPQCAAALKTMALTWGL